MAEPPAPELPENDGAVRQVSGAADAGPPLDSAIEELETLLGEQSSKLDAALRGALPPAVADIPTLDEVVEGVDPAVFPPLTPRADNAGPVTGEDGAEPGAQHGAAGTGPEPFTAPAAQTGAASAPDSGPAAGPRPEAGAAAADATHASQPEDAPSIPVPAPHQGPPDTGATPPAVGTDAALDANALRETVRSVVSEELRDVVDSVRSRIMSELGQGTTDASPPGAIAPIAPDLNYTSEQTATSPMTDSSESTAAAAPAAAVPTLDKHYDPHALEREWYERWEASGRFAAAGDDTAFCIVLPPPNITGSLHMGHAFQDTLMDALIRFKRMDGFQTLWQCGTDHAGIATQMVVERQLARNNLTRHQIGRDRFVDTVWAWKRKSGDTITKQLRRMGASMDWSRERFTLDEGLSAAVHQVFIRLYDEGLIYRGKRLVNWDPKLHTAISDLEVVSAEESGHLWHIRYPLADGSGHVVVATTRPETMLGDTAVAVNPADDRYRRIIGKQIQLPLTERLISVIADDYVDPEFGSGCVKITPAHDFNDYEVGERHGLERINIFTIDAVVNDNAPPKYQGMGRYAARKQIVADLDDLGLLVRVDDHRMMVPRGDRSGVVVEPMLTDQWFVRIQPLADPAIAAVEDGRVRFIPENYAKTYFEWMRNIQDWCISRQLWWGHRIPAWYDEAGNVYVGDDEADARRRNGVADDVPLEQDQDVLDTWFSSALWPFSTLGWPEQTPELKTFYPTSVLVTGFDIIFFWVARMIMMGLKFMGDVPFREVYIHGLVRDGDGNKMSKSKGNVLDPMDLIDGVELDELIEKRTTGLMRPEDAPKIEKATRRHFPDGIPSYGTDALRFTFAALATLSPDIKFDLGRIEGYRNFCNKIWNAARFILMVTGSETRTDEVAVVELGLPERWIKARLDATVETVRDHFENYRFDLAAQAIYEFIWDEFCDWYLEAAKITLNDTGATPARKLGARQTLLTTFETSLRLAHPLIPYITEELWQQIAPLLDIQGDFIMTQRYPLPKTGAPDTDAVTEFAFVQEVVRGVRRIRAEYDLDPRKSVPVLASGGSTTEQEWLARNLKNILSLARLQRIESVVHGQEPQSATALAGSMKLLVPLADLIDPEAERVRLDRELGKLRAELEQAQKKLANESFVSRAPADVVDKARARVADARSAIASLEEQRARIDSL